MNKFDPTFERRHACHAERIRSKVVPLAKASDRAFHCIPHSFVAAGYPLLSLM